MRVLVVDDSAGFLRAVAGFLGTLPDVEVVGQALTGGHGLRMAQELQPVSLMRLLCIEGTNESSRGGQYHRDDDG